MDASIPCKEIAPRAERMNRMTKSLLALCGLLAASALTAHLMAEAPLPPAMAFALSIGTALLLGFGAYWLLVRRLL